MQGEVTISAQRQHVKPPRGDRVWTVLEREDQIFRDGKLPGGHLLFTPNLIDLLKCAVRHESQLTRTFREALLQTPRSEELFADFGGGQFRLEGRSRLEGRGRSARCCRRANTLRLDIGGEYHEYHEYHEDSR